MSTIKVLLPIVVSAFIAVRASAQERAGSAWHFSSFENNQKALDVHHATKTRGSRPLRGASCCSNFTVAFPTNDTFALSIDGCQVATGAVRKVGGGVRLVPDERSVQVLRWWAENEVEEHWNAGVFGLDVALRWTEIRKVYLVAKARMVGERPVGSFDMALRVRGAVQRISRAIRPGPAVGEVRVHARYQGVGTADEDDEYECVYPPEVGCAPDEYSEEIRPAADYCYEP